MQFLLEAINTWLCIDLNSNIWPKHESSDASFCSFPLYPDGHKFFTGTLAHLCLSDFRGKKKRKKNNNNKKINSGDELTEETYSPFSKAVSLETSGRKTIPQQTVEFSESAWI